MTTRRLLPWLPALLAGLLAVGWIGTSLLTVPPAYQGFDLQSFGRIPVSYGGRHKPFDTVARNSLTSLSGRQQLTVYDEQGQPTGTMPAIAWLLEVMVNPETADDLPVFRVNHREVRTLIGLDDPEQKMVSYSRLAQARDAIRREAQRAGDIDRPLRSAYEHQLLALASEITLFESLASHTAIHSIPLSATGRWASLSDVLLVSRQTGGNEPPALTAYRSIFNAWYTDNPEAFNRQSASLRAALGADHRSISTRAAVEWRFNIVAPFDRSLVLYVIAALIVMISWAIAPLPLLRTAWVLIVLALLIHTAGLAVRVYLSGRPPVTNLYSSAVMLGWGVVLLSLPVELILRRGMGLLVGAVIGVTTLLIAQSLSADGDTLAVLQAVLDTNFWLATHVIVICIGYMGVFLAGALGILYILLGVLTRNLDAPLSRRIAGTIYGVTCLATLASFIGTILGGIWADQSWGRFWGWDPKENGALLIVLWCAIMLHARFGGLVRDRGLAVLAVFGNIVCAWSWFGTNMLGAGLHAYGFTEGGLIGMAIFLAIHAVLLSLGTLPIDAWRSGAQLRRPPRARTPDRLPSTT